METRMSVARYLSGAETMKPRELVYGVVREPPAPTYGHQSALRALVLRPAPADLKVRLYRTPTRRIVSEWAGKV
jgi:hypothetical protein